jgi:DNA-binding GntR family transcriptional regulator
MKADARRDKSVEAANGQGPEAIVRVSLHDELISRLRDLIIEGELAPGSKVPERELCDRFQVSRTPLREALKVLASEGLLILAPNRGATVSKLTVRDLDEIFPVMGALEALSGELAASRITEAELAEVRALHEEMVGHFERRELSPYFRLNQKIHEKIMEAAGNPTLAQLHRSLNGRVRRARYLANMSPVRWAQAVEEHTEILEALEHRDPVSLGAILRKHLHNKCETVKESLLTEEQQPLSAGHGA